MLKVHNFWSAVGAVILAIIVYDLWTKGSTTTQLATTTSQFGLGLVNALKVG